MRYLAIVGLMAVLAVPALAQTNPWAPAQTTVPVTVTVATMTELWTNVAPVALTITDGGAVNASSRSAPRTLNHLNNVGINISVSIDGDIPDNTYFYVVLNPINAATWNNEAPYGQQEKFVSWLRQGGAYLGSNVVGTVVPVCTRPATVFGADTIIYAAQVSPVPSAVVGPSVTGFNVVWTVAPTA